MNRRVFFIVLFFVFLVGCQRLPGQGEAFELGPIKMGMGLDQLRSVYPGDQARLLGYDTPRGQNWIVESPFRGRETKPKWLTRGATHLTMTFWEDRLLRVRVHRAGSLDEAFGFKERFDRGYDLAADLSRGETLFLEYDAEPTKIFLKQEGNEIIATYVDRVAFGAMDESRGRWRKKAAAELKIEGLRFGMNEYNVRQLWDDPGEETDFFAGLEGRRWRQDDKHRECILGFDSEWGLAAVAFLYLRSWSEAEIKARLFDLQKRYGSGEYEAVETGYAWQNNLPTAMISFHATRCDGENCQVSEGWLWRGRQDSISGKKIGPNSEKSGPN
ncbi:MAG: hypothetical protein P9L99_19910 [Candidatus Lernaella stagnicola]|nr:hypothetical protein [Candidatus Lernaella stagnicola]